LLIAAIAGTVTYRKSATKRQYVAELENVLREANRVSVATGRGVNKQEFIDAYKTVTYDWDRKKYGPGSANREFDDVQSHIGDAITAWDAAKNLWEMRDAYREGRTDRYHLGQAITLLPDAIGRDAYNQLDRAAKAQDSSVFAESNLGDLISLCFTAASSHLTDAEIAMNKLRR
jgi:hypothetical protein